MNNFRVRIIIAFSIVFVFSATLRAQEKENFRNVNDAIAASQKLQGKSGPKSLNWIDGGDRYSYITTNDSTHREEIRSFDPANGKDRLIFDAKGVTFPDTTTPFNYRSFQWAHDSRHILFETNFRKIYRKSGESDYYVYSLADKSLKAAAMNARTAELSPDGSMVGYERGGNMFVYDFATKSETQLTNDATREIFNGHFDWVYEEEFGQPQAWNWSPDSKYIAYWHFDESPVPIIQITNYEGLHNKWVKIPIPQVGDPNPIVKVGVLDVMTHKNIWLDTGLKGDYYIPRLYWTSEPNILAMMMLNRAQDDMKLFFFNVKTGERRLVMEEKSKTWISIFNFYTNVNDMIFFPRGIRQFFWVSDTSGYYQIYRYDYVVVEPPGGDGRIRDANFEHSRMSEHRVDCAVTAVARSHYSHLICIDVRKRRKVAGSRDEIMALPVAEFFVDNLHEGTAVIGRAAIVDINNDISILREPLTPSGRLE